MDTEKPNKSHFEPEVGRGCSFCNCGTECEAQACGGCCKLHETAWLDDYPVNETSDLEIVEVRFKNTRRSFYQNATNTTLKTGDIVAVEASPGHDIGVVSLTGDLVARQMRRTGFNPYNGEYKKVYRKAKPYDIERWQEAIALEHETMIAARQIAADMGLNMKIGDVEYQGDKIKAIFYYIADERVDFRELIKVFAERFHIRIEMKQIGARQEAGRIGGLGACGRELCCASWMSNFSSVTTGAARAQELSLNPQKLAGQCSKLKCCMMYEYDAYVDARKEFPRLKEPLQALDGEYYLVKNDILGGTMTFSSSKEAMVNVTTLTVARVKEIMAMNRAGKKVDQLLPDEDMRSLKEEPSYTSGSEEDSITRFDQTKRRKKNKRNRTDRSDRNEVAAKQESANEAREEGKTDAKGEGKPSNGNKRQGQQGDRTQRQDRRQRRNNGRTEGETQAENGGAQQTNADQANRPQRDNRPRRNNRTDRVNNESSERKEGQDQRQDRRQRTEDRQAEGRQDRRQRGEDRPTQGEGRPSNEKPQGERREGENRNESRRQSGENRQGERKEGNSEGRRQDRRPRNNRNNRGENGNRENGNRENREPRENGNRENREPREKSQKPTEGNKQK